MNHRTAARACLLAGSAMVLAACSSSDGNNTGNGTARGETVTVDTFTTDANDLRGLSFAPDGRIYASGHTDANPDDRMTVVMRFLADGTPDSSFGGDGSVELNLAPNGGDEQSYGIVVLANGDIVAAVQADDGNGGDVIASTPNGTTSAPREGGLDVLLVRLDSDGAPVNTFGTNGVATVPYGWVSNAAYPAPSLSDAGEFSNPGFPQDRVWDLKLDTSGSEERLVVFGFGSAPQEATQRFDEDRYITRLLASTGAVDPGFNSGNAFTWTSNGDFTDNARRGHVAADGSIFSAGYTNFGDGFRHHVVLIKLSESGVLDPSFVGFGETPFTASPAEDGIAIFNPFRPDGGFAECYAVIPQSDGSLVTTGYGGATGDGVTSSLGYETTQAQDVVSFRVPAAGGDYDRSFGTAGTLAIQSEAVSGTATFEDRGRHIVALSDDRTVHVGRYGGDAALFVVNASGQLDTSVDDNGIIELPDSNITAQFFGIAQSPDGSRVAATTNSDDNGARLVIVDF